MRGLAGAAAIALLAGAGGAIIRGELAAALDDVRRIRTILDAKSAIEGGRPDGVLTIVRETESKKYRFLNKRSYEVHTSSSARAGTALRGDDPDDKARADRHAEARRKKNALAERLQDGSWRVTIAAGLRSAELIANPAPIPHDTPWGAIGLVLAIAFVLGATIAQRLSPAGTWSAIAVLTGIALVIIAQVGLQSASAGATSYLSEGGRQAPAVALPALIVRTWLAAATIAAAGLAAFLSGDLGARAARALSKDRHAYVALAPAMIGLGVLVGIPFAFGMGLSLFHHEHGAFTFVGLGNFIEIIAAPGQSLFRPQTLPYSLALTILWTGLNVTLHLGIGLALALVLRRHAGRWSRLYRVVLIVPWAVPSYLTALIWRSLFDPDIGAINRLLGLEGLSWMHSAPTAFAANLLTNVWLGFPFMMVVCLGALTSIPQDLYEAAEVDGASRFQQLRMITIPLLKPALVPAVLLGSIWTFNKFEVIYLVSEGKPDGATDILVTESYRWAFERGLAQGGAYGYAAAYSVIIFVVLLLYAWMTSRVTRAAEEALR